LARRLKACLARNCMASAEFIGFVRLVRSLNSPDAIFKTACARSLSLIALRTLPFHCRG
jgi:hypothetical protein